MNERERARLLDPVDRVSEIMFGLIMAVTFVGAISVATAGREDVRTALASALGCNLAWGLVDAVMFLIRTMTDRTRQRNLVRHVAQATPEAGRQTLRRAIPDHLTGIVGEETVEGMRQRVSALAVPSGRLLRAGDFAAALGIFMLVVVTTFPVVVPFLLTQEVAKAMSWSRGMTVVLLFAAGYVLGRHVEYPRPWLTGAAMAIFGAVLIVTVMALGG
jgi:VIT1/CCC1 family predicted Fe2+/Mn2+ transporter